MTRCVTLNTDRDSKRARFGRARFGGARFDNLERDSKERDSGERDSRERDSTDRDSAERDPVFRGSEIRRTCEIRERDSASEIQGVRRISLHTTKRSRGFYKGFPSEITYSCGGPLFDPPSGDATIRTRPSLGVRG